MGTERRTVPFGRRIEPNEPSLGRSLSPESGPPRLTGPEKPPDPVKPVAASLFQARKSSVRLEDVVLNEETRKNLKRLMASVRNYDELSDWCPRVFERDRKYLAVNFYGPPGTGKTMCAEALAAQFDRPILEVNYAELESELWGKSSKNIQLAFRSAREQEAILFFDEADSVLGSRIKDPGHSSDQHVNLSRSVLLKQLDSFNGIVMFATNLAKNYDRAFVRRIFQHIEIPLPDHGGRKALWMQMLTNRIPGYAELDFDAIATASDGLAGGDIANVIRQALPDVHDRQAEERVLRISDLTVAIEDVRKSKRDVGAA